MKKIILLLFLSSLLAACGTSAAEEKEELFDTIDTISGIDIVRDVRTGCIYYYYVAGYQAAFSPYYDEEGQVAGCGEEQLDQNKYGLE